MKEGLIKDSVELVVREFQTLLSVIYLAMVGIGMLFTHQKYSQFNIDIFDYSDIFDFLIAPFQDISILIATIIGVLLSLLIFRLDKFAQRKFPRAYSILAFGWDKKSWYDSYRYLVFVFMLLVYVFTASNSYGKHIKKKVLDQEEITITYMDNSTVSGIQIGKTQETVFILDGEDIHAIPVGSTVKKISHNQWRHSL